ncbi:MAG: glycosyltransferase family 39 protein [Desulfurococcus sp.]|nr:glycosyltransferase family 39 protein [Desulfurococcus sp.]
MISGVVKGRSILREVLIAVVIGMAAFTVFALSALQFQELESSRNGRGYVSDEVWYVGSARILLVKVFGLEPRMASGSYGYTVIYEGNLDLELLKDTAAAYGLELRSDYSKLKAFYVYGDRENVLRFMSEIQGSVKVVDAIPGWMLPDNEGINRYLNLEHPPLGKYLIALSIYALGDEPFTWRIPLILAGSLTVVLVYLSVRKLSGSTLIALTSAVLLVAEPLSRVMFSLALLDGFVAFTSMLSFYLAVHGRYKGALLAGILGGLFKLSGLFSLIPLALIYLRQWARRNPSTLFLAYNLLALAFTALVLYLALLTLISLPLISYLGTVRWIRDSLLNPLKWHTSVKCMGAGCPVSSSPWDWFLGANAFPVYLNPDVYAEGFTPFWSTVFISILVFAPLAFRDKKHGLLWLYLLGSWSGYVLLWLAGGRTQYSFYSIQLAPFVYMYLVYTVTYVVNKANISYLISLYRLAESRLKGVVIRVLTS